MFVATFATAQVELSLNWDWAKVDQKFVLSWPRKLYDWENQNIWYEAQNSRLWKPFKND